MIIIIFVDSSRDIHDATGAIFVEYANLHVSDAVNLLGVPINCVILQVDHAGHDTLVLILMYNADL